MKKDFGIWLGQFLDDFRRASKTGKKQMMQKPPPSAFSHIQCAYMAAVVETLCLEHAVAEPDWIFDKRYFLHRPYFAGGLESMKALLLLESPVPFRRRNIFVSENALSRV